MVQQMEAQNAIAHNTFLELERVAASSAMNFLPPVGPATTLAPPSDTATFSLVGPDPLIVENESRFQILEQTLRNAERHAAAMEDKALEHEESIRRLTANYESSRMIAERDREAEAAEYERRLSSESAAKLQKQQEVQRLAAQTADLGAHMLQQTR